MSISNPRNMGASVKTVDGLLPQNVTANILPAVANKTPAYDRSLDNFPQSCVLRTIAGALAGGGTFDLITKVQHSPDGITWADYLPPPKLGVVQVAAPQNELVAANTSAEVDVDLSGADKFVAIDVKPNLAGGATGILASAFFVFGGAAKEPL